MDNGAELVEHEAKAVAGGVTPEPDKGPQPQFGCIEEIELLVLICGFLAPKDIGRLACTSASFGRKTKWRGDTVERSVAEESARRWVMAQSEVEQESVRLWTDESWLRRMYGIMSLLPPRWWCDTRWTTIALSDLTRWGA